MLNRRELIVGTSRIAECFGGASRTRRRNSRFIRRSGTSFTSGGKPYRIAGTNMWYAAYLGADAPIGNRDRLKRELDRLVGARDQQCADPRLVRILAAQEFGPADLPQPHVAISMKRC